MTLERDWLVFADMTTPTDRDKKRALAGLFEDLPEPSQVQVQVQVR